MIEDRKLTERFSLYDLTKTYHADLQEQNRQLTEDEAKKLVGVGLLLERCEGILGGEIEVHSARRCPVLNTRVGSTPKSQHLLCEAADFSPKGPDTEESIKLPFGRLAAAVKNGTLKIGQLILESQVFGREGRKVWIHASLGMPYRDPARCGQVLVMRDGKYETYKGASL